MRIEKDSLGELKLQDDVYYGIQTARAIQNFHVSNQTLNDRPLYIRCIAAIKKGAAQANQTIGLLDERVGEAIRQAAREIMHGDMQGQFPVDVYQGGGGTSTNMNVNEVIANRANEIISGKKGNDIVHPNTHVNMCQSTNDVIPSAIKMSCGMLLRNLTEEVASIKRTWESKRAEFDTVVKLGRTCLQDAVPMTIGQQFGAYVHFLERHEQMMEVLEKECDYLPLGATAVGTGIGAHADYDEHVFLFLSKIMHRAYKQEKNLFDGLSHADLYLRISAALKSLATGISKMATDLRLMSSGPRAGLSEIILPAVQPGSSIMPGKINPVMPELMNQIAYKVVGNDATVTMAVEGGELDLNVWEPVIFESLYESFSLLLRGMERFTRFCVKGLSVDRVKCREHAESSLALSTVLAALFDYRTGCEVAAYAEAHNLSIHEAAMKLSLLTEDQAKNILDPSLMADRIRFAKMIEVYKKDIGKDTNGKKTSK